jgi:hypothetical protein
MKKTIIKSIDEFYSQTLTGDSFNSSNGVFKVDYKPYSDLSISVGRDPDPSILIKDSRFQVGDFVEGNVQGRKKSIKGEVIDVSKSQDGKFYIIKIQSKKNKRTYTLIPGSIEFTEDTGNIKDPMSMNITARERMAQNTKYSGGNVVWGSLENEDRSHISFDPEYSNGMEGPFGTGWKIKFEEQLPQGNKVFGDIISDKENKIMFCLVNDNTEYLKNLLKAAEAYVFLINHEDLSDSSIDLKTLMSIIFLEIKNEVEPKKILIQNFPEITGRSYGESRDEHFEKAKSMIDRFL